MRKLRFLLLNFFLLCLISFPALAQDSGFALGASSQEPSAGRSPLSGKDAGELGCATAEELPPLPVADLMKIVDEQNKALTAETDKDKKKEMQTASDNTILALLQGRKLAAPATADEIKELIRLHASAEVLNSVTNGPEVYIGWSVIPSRIVTDNYGHYVRRKYFAIDVAIANRAKDSLIVTALEFCNNLGTEKLRDVTSDPALVRGTLQKGELTGTRTIVAATIQAVGDLATPSAAFFKNQVHRGTFSGIASLFNPLKTGFDLVWPETILTYLQNWDKDEVFKKGFVVSAGGSARGRVFIPIELIYARPANKKDPKYQDALRDWKEATEGDFDVKKVKAAIGRLVVLGQSIELKNQRRFSQ